MSERKQDSGAFIEIIGHKCYRCGHEWKPTSMDKAPKACPKCKSPYWDEPLKRKEVSDKIKKTLSEKN